MEVTMQSTKRFLLSVLLCLSINTLPAAPALHRPAQGPLPLGYNGYTSGIRGGIIMETIMSNPDFHKEKEAIQTFLNLTVNHSLNQSYQQIIQSIGESTHAAESIAVIEAFEKALMHKYHYDTYLVGSYRPWQSIFFTGIKYSWVNPAKWINPRAWISDQDPNLKQILEEMESLAKVANKHSIITAQRINATVQSYRHWRRNIALAIVAYLAADTCKRGRDSSICDLGRGGLHGMLIGNSESNTPIILEKFADNLCSAANFTQKATVTCASIAYQITKPVINLALYGTQGTQATETVTSSPGIKTKFRNWWNKTSEPALQPAQTTPRWGAYFKDTAASYVKQVQDRWNAQ